MKARVAGCVVAVLLSGCTLDGFVTCVDSATGNTVYHASGQTVTNGSAGTIYVDNSTYKIPDGVVCTIYRP